MNIFTFATAILIDFKAYRNQKLKIWQLLPFKQPTQTSLINYQYVK
jgi:hypothetical protein